MRPAREQAVHRDKTSPRAQICLAFQPLLSPASPPTASPTQRIHSLAPPPSPSSFPSLSHRSHLANQPPLATGHTTAAEPADATQAPATSTETPAESEEIGAKTTDPAPAAPTSTPAPGMSATSGPLDDHPAFELKEEK